VVDDTTFIGVDLAWKSDRNHTGAAVFRGGVQGVQLVSLSDSIATFQAVHEFVSGHTTLRTCTAIDAPLIIINATGQRPCETAVGTRYGAREASCHTSNLRLFPNAPSVALAEDLVSAGYVHAPEAPESASKLLLEVYPHAALVALFDLPKSLKYKKGNLTQKQFGLGVLAAHIRKLFNATPALVPNALLEELLSRDLTRLPRSDLKKHEDLLDAVVCAYLACYFWCWRMDRNEVFGDIHTGYILNPTLLVGGIEAYAA
jgi:predicted RNase H-like nuclease